MKNFQQQHQTLFLVRSDIFGLFVNTMTTEYKYSGRNMQNFQQRDQTQLSQKRKAFSGYFIAFVKCVSSLEHFEKEDKPSSFIIHEIIHSTGSGYLNV